MEMDTVKAKMMYPDATFTMRVSYGNVKTYRPRDGVFYDYVCTMKGVLEKYKPGDYEFDLPARQIELAKKKDFGQYIDKQKRTWLFVSLPPMILPVVIQVHLLLMAMVN